MARERAELSGPGHVRRVGRLITEAEVLFSGAELDGAAEPRHFCRAAQTEHRDRDAFGAWPGAESKPGTFRAGAAETFGPRRVASVARLADGRNIKGEAPPDWGKYRGKNRRCDTADKASVLEVIC